MYSSQKNELAKNYIRRVVYVYPSYYAPVPGALSDDRRPSSVSSKELPEPGQEVVLWRNPVTS